MLGTAMWPTTGDSWQRGRHRLLQLLTMRLPGAERSGLKLRSSAGPKELKAAIWPAVTLLGTTTCSGQNVPEDQCAVLTL